MQTHRQKDNNTGNSAQRTFFCSFGLEHGVISVSVGLPARDRRESEEEESVDEGRVEN